MKSFDQVNSQKNQKIFMRRQVIVNYIKADQLQRKPFEESMVKNIEKNLHMSQKDLQSIVTSTEVAYEDEPDV